MFDMKSVMENYAKNGELVCSSSQHESESSFKSRSICLDKYSLPEWDVSFIDTDTDKASISIFAWWRSEMFALKSKLSFWNGKDQHLHLVAQ